MAVYVKVGSLSHRYLMKFFLLGKLKDGPRSVCACVCVCVCVNRKATTCGPEGFHHLSEIHRSNWSTGEMSLSSPH